MDGGNAGERPKIPWPGAWFKVGESQLNVVQEAPLGQPSRSHLSLEVDDFDGMVKRMQELGIPLQEAPEHRQSGARYFRVQDPEGRIIEFTSHHGSK